MLKRGNIMWWKQSESIHFDWITSDLFQVIWDYESALKDWTDKKWKTEFEQKMKAREYSDDICKVVWKELERFLIWRIKELERQKEEKEAKQLPEVVELMDEYNFSQTNLKKEKSKENYLAVFHACYSIIANWGIVGCLDEFAGVYKCFKEAVFDYLSTARTVESLYSVVFYYTDRRILESYNDRKARKQHLQEGLKYVKAFNETVDDEKSALIYIDCYLQMTQCCRTGEDLEELSYADKAYKLAKKFALKYKSEIMLEELDLAKLTLKVYYQTHNQETEAERIEKEFEKIKEQI